MGQLTRSYDWSQTSIGAPDVWPQSLRTTLSILLNATFPMVLFWGRDLLCFYNDAYRTSLGNTGKQPHALGKPGAVVWTESWPDIKPLIDQVLAAGEATRSEDQLIPIYRNGALEDVYWTFSYSPVSDETGNPAGVFMTCTETVRKSSTVRKLQISEQRFQNLVRDASVGIIVLDGQEMRVNIVNDAYARLINRRCDELIDRPLFDIIPDAEAVFRPIIDQVRLTGDPLYLYGQPYIVHDAEGKPITGLLDLVYQPYREQDGAITGVMVLCQDVTKQKKAEEEITRFKYMAENASDAFILMREDGTFAYLNQPALERWGYTPEEARNIRVPDVDPIYNDDVFAAAFARAQQAKIPPFETLHRKKDGTIYHVEVNMGGLMLNDQPHLFAVARDIAERKKAEQDLKESEQRFQAAIVAVQGVLWTNNAAGEMTGEQPGWTALTGQTYEEYQGYGWSKVVHPDDAQPTVDAWNVAVREKRMFVFEHRLRLRDGTWGVFSIRAIPLLNADGLVREWVGVHTNVTQQRQAEQALRASENLFRNVTNSAPTGLWLSDETGGLTYLNNTLVDWTGLPYESLLGAGWASAIIEEDRPRSAAAFLAAVAARAHYDVIFRIRRSDGRISWCQAAGDPYYDAEGRYGGYAGFCMDVDELIKQRQTLETSEARFRSLIEEAPIPTCLFVGRDLVIEVANPSMIDVWGKGWSVIGRPLAQALPELESQPFLRIIDEVFTTGIMHETKAGRADLVINGELKTYYFDYTFKALRDTTGEIYAIMEMAVDVTGQVLSRQKVEESEITLRGAIEMAELGTFQIDLTTGLLDYSARTRAWFGIGPDEVITSERAYQPLREADRPRVREAIRQAITPGGTGIYDIEYTIDVAKRERILHITGKTFFTEQGQAYKLSGTVRDVTEQRKTQLALEQQVQERTEALATANEELAAINEEMATTNDELALINEELTQSNQLLFRSNDNLQQFAYIASHDLQEPLRKIQSFGDLLKNRYATQLGEGVEHLERMQVAASRMSTLIRDLLAFSRISTQQDTVVPVSLKGMINNVLNDLDLRVQETMATVTIGLLPTIQGDPLQLGQLFLNLFSNALKFRRVDESGAPVPPVIQIDAQLVTFSQLPPTVKPARHTSAYYRIDVRDNGIGFDDKYVDRIFQVFQRLHGRNEFAGTGIGLAICEKVAANHGGTITARSQPGQGATFSVYLPY